MALLSVMLIVASCFSFVSRGAADPSMTLVASDFVKYWQSDTTMDIQGMVMVSTSMNQEGTYQQTIRWSLTGTDDACPTGSGNVCGIHIHEFASCNADAQGHYFAVAEDPWTIVRYNSTNGASEGMATIVTGLSHDEIVGRSMVVHSSEGAGARVACALLYPQKPLIAMDFVKYFGSATNLAVMGYAVVMTSLDESGEYQQTLTWSLTGADDACPTGSGNVCGIHIHEVGSCDMAAGGHFFGVATDPWTTVRYESSGGVTMGSITMVTGLSPNDIKGKSLIVHNSIDPGERVACALLMEQEPVMAQAFVPYYNSGTTMDVAGTVVITTSLSANGTWQQTMAWALQGTDDACATGSGNQCGIHIHEVASCDVVAGGHYYSVSEDPWTMVRYNSTDGMSFGSAVVISGLPHADIMGKSLVVHSSEAPGVRVACALLLTDGSEDEGDDDYDVQYATGFVKYFGSDTSFMVEGVVSLTSSRTESGIWQQRLQWSLVDTDDACATGSGNVCGIHIHEVASCDMAAGGHFYNLFGQEDPWATVRYESVNGVSKGMATVVTGLSPARILGKSLVVHNSIGAGERIACALLTSEPHFHIATHFVKYYMSNTELMVDGIVSLSSSQRSDGLWQQEMAWYLTGTDDTCATGTGNVCGMHVHVASTCDADAGGHYFNASTDPWTSVRYESMNGSSWGSAIVVSGLSPMDLAGKAFVVHSSVGSGERVACALLGVASPDLYVATDFVKYYQSSTNLIVGGTAVIASSQNQNGTWQQTMHWDLTGADDACPTGSGNVCGIHIHQEPTCQAAAGGHFFGVDVDPWTSVRYDSTGGMTRGVATVVTGLTPADILGKSLVVHDSNNNGDRIACALVNAPSLDMMDNMSTTMMDDMSTTMASMGDSSTTVVAKMGDMTTTSKMDDGDVDGASGYGLPQSLLMVMFAVIAPAIHHCENS